MVRVNKAYYPWRQGAVFITVAIATVLLDQLTKWYIAANLEVGEVLFDAGFFRIIRSYNTGAAFGIFPESTPVLAAISFTGIVLLLLAGLWAPRKVPFLRGGAMSVVLGLMLGGTAGNFFDRLLLGRVTDFIDFGFWPSFNVADSSIVIGVILLAVTLLRSVSNDDAAG